MCSMQIIDTHVGYSFRATPGKLEGGLTLDGYPGLIIFGTEDIAKAVAEDDPSIGEVVKVTITVESLS